MQSYGDGARAIVRVRKSTIGHVFIAENKGGKIIYIDPQINERYTKLGLRKLKTGRIVFYVLESILLLIQYIMVP